MGLPVPLGEPSQIESQVNYSSTKFNRIQCERSRITKTEFYGCVFSHCNFQEAAFRECRFSDCTFVDCDLSLMLVDGSLYRETKFERSKVIGVNWTVAAWSKFMLESPLGFVKCIIDYSTFLGLVLRKIVFQECTAQDVEFSEADLMGADFSGTNLSLSRFRQTNLTKCNFVGASNYTIDLTTCKIAKAKFSMPEALSLLYGLDIILAE